MIRARYLILLGFGIGISVSALGASLPVKSPQQAPKSAPSKLPVPAPTEKIQVFQSNVPVGLTYSSEAILRVRDPFKSPDTVLEIIKKGELEKYSLDALKFVAITTGPDRVSALVLSPDSKTYFVRERMKIGLNGGVVKKITPEAIVVYESSLNILGEHEIVETIMELQAQSKFQKPEGEGTEEGHAKTLLSPVKDSLSQILGGEAAPPENPRPTVAAGPSDVPAGTVNK